MTSQSALRSTTGSDELSRIEDEFNWGPGAGRWSRVAELGCAIGVKLGAIRSHSGAIGRQLATIRRHWARFGRH